MSDKSLLVKYAGMDNILEELTQEQIADIRNRVVEGFKEDEQSNTEWMRNVEDVEKLANLSSEKKNTPIPDAANIKYPLITKACYEFSSRTYPEIVKDGEIVKARVLGKDLFAEKEK